MKTDLASAATTGKQRKNGRQQEEMLRDAYYDDLQAIARLKTARTLAWRHERRTDAKDWIQISLVSRSSELEPTEGTRLNNRTCC